MRSSPGRLLLCCRCYIEMLMKWFAKNGCTNVSGLSGNGLVC